MFELTRRLQQWLSHCLILGEEFSAISWQEEVSLKWDDNDVRFVLGLVGFL